METAARKANAEIVLHEAYNQCLMELFKTTLWYRLVAEPDAVPEEAQAAFSRGLAALNRSLDMALESLSDP